MYVVVIKESAIQANRALADAVCERGLIRNFTSRSHAEEFAAEISTTDGRLRIQKAAPQESNDIDGYLVSHPPRFTHEPKESANGKLTFDVSANLYGAIGEVLVSGDYGVAPGIRYYLEQTTEIPAAENGCEVVSLGDEIPRLETENDGTWHPDVVFAIKSTKNKTTIDRVYCEIKTGSASFDRNQRRVMEALAKQLRILTIRVDIRNLPDTYTIRVDEVDPSSSQGTN